MILSRDVKTRKFNEDFLMNEIRKLEVEREPLLGQRLEFTNSIYNRQQESKGEKFENGGLFGSDLLDNLCKKHNISKEAAIDIIRKFENGGQFQPHYMYNPETGDKQYVETNDLHVDLGNRGYIHQDQANSMLGQNTVDIINQYSEIAQVTPDELTLQMLGMTEEQLNQQVAMMNEQNSICYSI